MFPIYICIYVSLCSGAHDIANFLRGNTTLKALLIPDCGIGSDGCAAIADALSYEEVIYA